VEDALQLLSDENILSVPVQDKKTGRLGPHHSVHIKGSKIIGILNITDLATAIAFQSCFDEFKDKPQKIEDVNKETFHKLIKTTLFESKVETLIGLSEESKQLWEYQETEKLDTVLEVMSKGVHRVLVHTKDGKLRFLSQTDIVAFLKKHVKDLGSLVDEPLNKIGLVDEKAKILTVSMYEPALAGYQRMWNKGWELTSLPVVDKTGDVVATLSASDLRGLTKISLVNLLLPVLDFLRSQRSSRPTISSQPTSPLLDVLNKVVWSGVHRVWVIKNHKLVSVVSLSDIICKFSPFDFKKPTETS